jgi:hypothetical protein
VADFLLYGLNEAGEAAHSEVLRGAERSRLQDLARTRLARWHAVEIWEGPMCLLRVRRPVAAPRD